MKKLFFALLALCGLFLFISCDNKAQLTTDDSQTIVEPAKSSDPIKESSSIAPSTTPSTIVEPSISTTSPSITPSTTTGPIVTESTTKIENLKLQAPAITLTDNVVSWEAVDFAVGYIVKFNDEEQAMTTELSFTITALEAGSYVVLVMAVASEGGNNLNSDYSDSVTYVIKEKKELATTKCYLLGDSTMCSFADAYYLPRYGYGTQMKNYFDEKVTFINLAMSGRSSKSFLSEENYSTFKSSIKEGDYVIIGFGHNDEKNDDVARFTDASKDVTDSTSFKYSLYTYYVKVALDAGATPIIATPVVRYDSSNTYAGNSVHDLTSKGIGDYKAAAIELAEAYNLAYVDLTTIMANQYKALGADTAKLFHAVTGANSNDNGVTLTPNYNTLDATHLNMYGAKNAAYQFANALSKTTSLLADYVLENIEAPTYENDYQGSINTSFKWSSYKALNFVTLSSYSSLLTMTDDGYYGTVFGSCGGVTKGWTAISTATGVYKVGTTQSAGKLSNSADGFAYLCKQVSVSKNFKMTATAKILNTTNTKQAGFGLMIRDDCYEPNKETIATNYVAAGLNCSSDSSMVAIFSRSSATAITNSDNTISGLYAVDDTATLTIERLGQIVTATVIYKGITYTKSFPDFDLVAIDSNYMYIGMFATRGTMVEFSDVTFEITGEAIAA